MSGGWNYRVLKYPDGSLGIHEVFYADDGRPNACTEEAVGPGGENLDDLRSDLQLMLGALEKPVLAYLHITSAQAPSKEGT